MRTYVRENYYPSDMCAKVEEIIKEQAESRYKTPRFGAENEAEA